LQNLFASLRELVGAQAPAELRGQAVAHVEELEQSVIADRPDTNKIESIKRWFRDHLPALAGAVVSVIVHPLVGSIVAAAGERIANDA
jgi:hypothetical protein